MKSFKPTSGIHSLSFIIIVIIGIITIINDWKRDTLKPMNATLNKILEEKQKVMGYMDETIKNIGEVPVVGNLVVQGIECTLPLSLIKRMKRIEKE